MSDQSSNPQDIETRLLTVAEAARFLGCSEANVYSLISGGDIPYILIGRRKGIRLDRADLEAFIDSRKQQRTATPRKVTRPKLKHIRLK